MKDQQFPRLYGLLAVLCAFYFIFDEVSLSILPGPELRRKLIVQRNSCTSKLCSNLFFISGIYDVVNLDLRFTAPFEKHDPQTLFEKAYFSDIGVSKVKAFSSFEFFLYSQVSNIKNSISGAYDSDTLVNGSAAIIVSEYPGREVWFHSDALDTAPCINETTSLVVFANAMNSEATLYTKTPEGLCEKIQMEDDSSSPLTYCQTRDGYVWKIYTDWKCSTQNIASDYINGGLGTVYSVIIGNNLSSADLVTVSSHSTFEQTPTSEENKLYPSFFKQYNMVILVILVGLGSLCVLFVFGVSIQLQKSSGLGIHPGSLVVYELRKDQIERISSNDHKKSFRKLKTKGFALIVRAPTLGVLARLSTGWIGRLNLFPKYVLQLQPLKRVLRNEEKSFRDRTNSKSDLDEWLTSIELTVDELEPPIGMNKWGFRGGRVLFVFSPNSIQRRCIYIERTPQINKNSVRFADHANPEGIDLTEPLSWMEIGETALLLPKLNESSLRQRKGRTIDVSENQDTIPAEQSKKNICLNFWKNSFTSTDGSGLGSGWSIPIGDDDDFFLLDDQSSSTPLVHPHLKNCSFRYELETGADSGTALPSGMTFSYFLKNLPSQIAGEKFQRIYCREWIYPFTKDGNLLKRKKSSRRNLHRSSTKPAELPPLVSESLSPSSSVSIKNEPKKLLKASSKTEELLNVLIREHNTTSPMRISSDPIAAPNVSEFMGSPQPVSVRIAMRRELSRKNRVQLPSLLSEAPPVFTAPRLITSPLPVISNDLKVEEVSSPTSPMQSYFVTPPRTDSGVNRKATRQLSAELYSQTNKKLPKKPMMISPNSTPQLNHQGNSVNSSATTVPTSKMVVNADREVTTGMGTIDKVVTGSKLEIDDDEEDTPRFPNLQKYKHSTQSPIVPKLSSPIPLNPNPPSSSPRNLSRGSSTVRPSQAQAFTSSPKTLPIRPSPRKILSSRKSGESQKSSLQAIQWDDDVAEKQKPPFPMRASSKFDMDLSFLPDVTDD